ncbi:MAG: hypothetical protein FJZ63_05310 [Chlamydiae bacterium]|nr:hypothetical protein [Chlamydiota bacterium]
MSIHLAKEKPFPYIEGASIKTIRQYHEINRHLDEVQNQQKQLDSHPVRPIDLSTLEFDLPQRMPKLADSQWRYIKLIISSLRMNRTVFPIPQEAIRSSNPPFDYAALDCMMKVLFLLSSGSLTPLLQYTLKTGKDIYLKELRVCMQRLWQEHIDFRNRELRSTEV